MFSSETVWVYEELISRIAFETSAFHIKPSSSVWSSSLMKLLKLSQDGQASMKSLQLSRSPLGAGSMGAILSPRLWDRGLFRIPRHRQAPSSTAVTQSVCDLLCENGSLQPFWQSCRSSTIPDKCNFPLLLLLKKVIFLHC